MEVNTYIKAIEELNSKIYKKDSNPEFLFEYRTTGDFHFIYFGDFELYNSENDGRLDYEITGWLTQQVERIAENYKWQVRLCKKPLKLFKNG